MSEIITLAPEHEAEVKFAMNSGPPFGHLPDHTELPEEDGTFVKNTQEHPESILLTESIWPILQKLHPDGQFMIGQDVGIYWRLTDPPEKGATAPDWFYVPNVPPTLDGQMRRSYVLWQEFVSPLIIIEFVSATDGGERDRTPKEGKFWIYEQAIHAAFYAIYDAKQGLVDVYHFVEDRFRPVPPNERKHFPIPQLGIELGIWRGEYKNVKLPWLRFWDAQGNLLPTPEERAEQEAKRANQEAKRANQEAERANQEAERVARLVTHLRSTGLTDEQINAILNPASQEG